MARFSSFNTWITFSAKLIVLMKRKYGREGCEKECERVIKYGRENMYVYERVCEKLPGSRFFFFTGCAHMPALSHSCCLPHTLSPILSPLHSRAYPLSHSCSLSHTLSSTLSVKYWLSHTFILSLVYTLSHTLSLSLSLSLPLMLAHS